MIICINIFVQELRRRGQRPQGPGSHATQTAQRPAEHAGRKDGSPYEKAARRAMCCVVHPSVSVCPTAPEQNRTEAPVACQPWVAPVTEDACDHGPGLRVV